MIQKIRDNYDNYNYSIGDGFNQHLTRLTYEVLSKFFVGSSCLEVGCADGYGTQILVKRFKKVVAVDASQIMIDKLTEKFKFDNLEVIRSYIEDLDVNEAFSTIFMSHTLDTVDDAKVVLQTLKKFVNRSTNIIIEVPNAYSLHRQAGVYLGLLKNVHEFNEADRSVGHKRIYDMKSLCSDVEKVGLKVIAKGGFMLKPFSNSQMQKLIGNDIQAIETYSKLGEKYPDIAAEIYVICKL